MRIPRDMDYEIFTIGKCRVRNMFDINFDFDRNSWDILMDKRSIIEIMFDEVITEINKKKSLLEKLSNFFFKKQTKVETFVINLGY